MNFLTTSKYQNLYELHYFWFLSSQVRWFANNFTPKAHMSDTSFNRHIAK